MNKIPKITDTEWQIMRVIWARHPITAAEIIAKLVADDPSWHPKTVRTLLARLVSKKALDYEARGRLYVYEPLVSEGECAQAASESFVARVFGGSFKPLVAHFVERRKLTDQELQELLELLTKGKEQKSTKAGKKYGGP